MSAGHLVQPHELALGLPNTSICDVRWYLGEPDRGRSEYDEGHIPGAVFMDLDTDLSDLGGDGRHPLPATEAFGLTLGRMGIGVETSVVAYDGSGGAIASRLWWMLRSVGHQAVRVLDGGWSAWVAHGYPTSTKTENPRPCTHQVPADWAGIVDRGGVVAAMGTTAIVDARAPERFRGDIEPVDARPGHIPGAGNLPHAGNLDVTGRHLSPDRLSDRFAHLARSPIMYCGSGVTACHNLLAMAVSGRDDGVLYPGSWSDWAANSELPAELGEG